MSTPNTRTCCACTRGFVSLDQVGRKPRYCAECAPVVKVIGKKFENQRVKNLRGYPGYPVRTCAVCSMPFKMSTSRSKYCSKICVLAIRRRDKLAVSKAYHKLHRREPGYIFRKMMLLFIRRMVKQKFLKSNQYVQYSANQFRNHIENLFKPGMSWDNYGLWHVDHRRPLIRFKFVNLDGTENLSEIRAANALSNLQPLWAKENLSKNSKEEAA